MTSYVWSSNADELLLEWDLMLELYDRGFGLVPASCLEFCMSSACVLHVLTRVAVASGSPRRDWKSKFTCTTHVPPPLGGLWTFCRALSVT